MNKAKITIKKRNDSFHISISAKGSSNYLMGTKDIETCRKMVLMIQDAIAFSFMIFKEQISGPLVNEFSMAIRNEVEGGELIEITYQCPECGKIEKSIRRLEDNTCGDCSDCCNDVYMKEVKND